ncbi:MAG TPA: hypothetical protein PKC93_08020 [Candidatus Obscuribacter sp.]|nr:hypothetical protein [Candidatus Obscuribacter sp.]
MDANRSKGKVNSQKVFHAVATGEVDPYLAAHCECEPVFHSRSEKPHAYDLILDAEASNELFASYMQGRSNFQGASRAELLEFVDAMAEDMERRQSRSGWIGFVFRSGVMLLAVAVFVYFIALALGHK